MRAADGMPWRIRLPAEAESVPIARQFAAGYVRQQCADADVPMVLLAITELVSNAVRHAYPDGSGELEVEIRQVRDGAGVTVRDWGCGFGRSENPGLGIGLQVTRRFSTWFEIREGKHTEVEAHFRC